MGKNLESRTIEVNPNLHIAASLNRRRILSNEDVADFQKYGYEYMEK